MSNSICRKYIRAMIKRAPKAQLGLIGCGEAFDTGFGNNSCIFFGERLPTVLFDCGYQIPERLWALAPGLRSVDAVYLTHFHADHAMGLAPLIVRQIFHIIAEINRAGMTILLVEQNAHQALRLASRGYVMANGRVVLAGTGKDLLANPEVRAAYLEGGHGGRH